MAQTNQYFEILSRGVFRRMMSSKTIEIMVPFTKGLGHPIPESDSHITLENYEYIEKTLQIFGHEIKKIDLKFQSSAPDQQNVIHQLIEKCCSKTLISLASTNSLTYFTVPFEKVKNVTFVGALKSTGNGLKLNQIFPKLCRLDVHSIDLHDCEVLDIEFPQLTRFTLTIPLLNDIYSNIEKFIKKNSQIRYLTFIHCNSFNYIKLINEHLPNLETLQLNLDILSEEYTGPKIHFDRVKNLKMNWGQYDFSGVVEFDQLLESLELTCDGVEGINFATKFENLTRLQLVVREIDDDDILKLSQKLKNLTELTISSLSEIDENTIFQLVEQSKRLENFKLSLSYVDHFKALINRFSNDWTVATDGNDIFMNKITKNSFRYGRRF